MKRRRNSHVTPRTLRAQSSRPDFRELLRMLGIAAEENNSGHRRQRSSSQSLDISTVLASPSSPAPPSRPHDRRFGCLGDRREGLTRPLRSSSGLSPEAIETLAAKGVDLSGTADVGGLAAIHRAALAESTGALRTLLRAGVDKDAVETAGGRTALHFAVLRSHAESVEALIVAGANKEARDADGRTPLHLSCIVRPSDPAIPLYLIGAGAAVSAADAHGTTPLDIAVRYGCAATVRAILRSATAPRPSPRNTGLLYEAVRVGNASVVRALVDSGWETGVPLSTVSPEAPPPPAEDPGAATAAHRCAVGEVLSPLMLAADSGRPEVVKALLRGRKKGFPDAGDACGYTALHFATVRGSVDIVEALLGEGRADPDAVNVDGDTALHVAAATGRTNVGEALLRAGASVAIANRQGHTALHFAAAGGLTRFSKCLLEKGADVGASRKSAGACERANGAGSSPGKPGRKKKAPAAKPRKSAGGKRSTGAAVAACRRSGRFSGKSCSKERRDSSRGDEEQGVTPLHFAAINGRAEATRVLLQAGADAAHRRNEKLESPLFFAARSGHAEVVRLLLEKLEPRDVDVATSSGETPLSAACASGHADVVDELIRKGTDVSRMDLASDRPSLDVAVTGARTASRTRVVKALLRANADPDGGGTGTQYPPLHSACRVGGGAGAVEALLEAGADADADAAPCGEKRLLRPLHVAAVHGNTAAVNALTLRGCRLDAKTLDPSRSTPLVLAVQQGHVETARALIEAGARVDVVPRREDGTERAPSLARLAADMKRGDMVSLLVGAMVKRDSFESWMSERAAKGDAGTAQAQNKKSSV